MEVNPRSMKAYIVTILSVVSLCHSLHARVGETDQEIKVRFGEGGPSDIQRQVGAKTLKFIKNNFQVEVVLHNGRSIWEIYRRLDVGGEMPAVDVQNILDGYKAQKRTWRFDRREKRWDSSTKPKLIAHLWPGHEDHFSIKDVEACEALDKAATGSKGL